MPLLRHHPVGPLRRGRVTVLVLVLVAALAALFAWSPWSNHASQPTTTQSPRAAVPQPVIPTPATVSPAGANQLPVCPVNTDPYNLVITIYLPPVFDAESWWLDLITGSNATDFQTAGSSSRTNPDNIIGLSLPHNTTGGFNFKVGLPHGGYVQWLDAVELVGGTEAPSGSISLADIAGGRFHNAEMLKIFGYTPALGAPPVQCRPHTAP